MIVYLWAQSAKKQEENVGSRLSSDMKRKTHMATEVRNYLMAAIQNLRSADQQLENITFPYCGPEEVSTVGRAAQHVFTDMQSPERHTHAYQCYDATHKRCAALLYWFTEVGYSQDRPPPHPKSCSNEPF